MIWGSAKVRRTKITGNFYFWFLIYSRKNNYPFLGKGRRCSLLQKHLNVNIFRGADSRKPLLRRDIITVAHPPRETIYASVDPEKPFPPFFLPLTPFPQICFFSWPTYREEENEEGGLRRKEELDWNGKGGSFFPIWSAGVRALTVILRT